MQCAEPQWRLRDHICERPYTDRTLNGGLARSLSGDELQSENLIRVLVVDDHSLVRKGISLILQSEFDIEVVGQVGSGEEAIRLYGELRPDVTLMDLRMPGLNGVDTIEQIRRSYPFAKFIILTLYSGDEDIYRCLRAGARAYLLKDTPCYDLVGAIRSVRAGHRQIPPQVGEVLAARAGFDALTERESDVLRLIVKGMSNSEISAALFIAEGTVKFHVSHILEKLNVSDRTQAVITALKRGLAQL